MRFLKICKCLVAGTLPVLAFLGVVELGWLHWAEKGQAEEKKVEDYVTVAILARDKAHTLPIYLQCLEKQTWPKNHTFLYVRTNNNTDATAEILNDWVDRVRDQYAGVYFDDSRVDEPIEQYGPHDWNTMKFKVLGKIRQDSVGWAREHHSHYFVADCDNFILPETIESMVSTRLPVVAPFLRCHRNGPYSPTAYSNYHAVVDGQGYFKDDPVYYTIWRQEIRGLIQVPVVHCTYLLRKDVLERLCYDDGSGLHEYVIFSSSARKQKIPQYLDNRRVYGYITFADSAEEFAVEPWLPEIRRLVEPGKHSSFVARKTGR